MVVLTKTILKLFTYLILSVGLLFACLNLEAFAAQPTDSTANFRPTTAPKPYKQSYVLVDKYVYWQWISDSDWPPCPLFVITEPGCPQGYTAYITYNLIDTDPNVGCGSCLRGDIDNVTLQMTIASASTSSTRINFCAHVYYETGHGNSDRINYHYTVHCSAQ